MNAANTPRRPATARSPRSPRSLRSPQSVRWRRRVVGIALAGVALLLVGCRGPIPQITVLGDGQVSTVTPTLWCRVTEAGAFDCPIDAPDSKAPRLALDAGQPLVINVPAAVADQPWVVLVQYRDAAGNVQKVRSELFPAGSRLMYVVEPPTPADQLLRIDVQSGLTAVANQKGDAEYAATHTWVLLIEA